MEQQAIIISIFYAAADETAHTDCHFQKKTVDIQIYQDFPDITSLVFIKTNHVSIKISFLLIEFILNKITGSH
jgi:hypothetical protein